MQSTIDSRTELLSGEDLLVRLFPTETSRPSLRWLRSLQYSKAIPSVRLGRLIFFNPTEVEKAIQRRTVQPKGAK
ncbi:MAG: hypothetical protein ACI9OD_001677 [Limisphaerales bacterium]|jgi:hypothetical protein